MGKLCKILYQKSDSELLPYYSELLAWLMDANWLDFLSYMKE